MAACTGKADLNNDGKVTRSESNAFNKTKLGKGKKKVTAKKKSPVKKTIKKACPFFLAAFLPTLSSMAFLLIPFCAADHC